MYSGCLLISVSALTHYLSWVLTASRELSPVINYPATRITQHKCRRHSTGAFSETNGVKWDSPQTPGRGVPKSFINDVYRILQIVRKDSSVWSIKSITVNFNVLEFQELKFRLYIWKVCVSAEISVKKFLIYS